MERVNGNGFGIMTHRHEFPASVQREALERSHGACECYLVPQLPTFGTGCGCALGPGNTFFEHITPCELGGNNSIENAAVLVKTCWRAKTDCYDLPIIAKAKRNFDSNNGIRRPRRLLPGGRGDPFYFTPGSTQPLDRQSPGKPWRGSQ